MFVNLPNYITLKCVCSFKKTNTLDVIYHRDRVRDSQRGSHLLKPGWDCDTKPVGSGFREPQRGLYRVKKQQVGPNYLLFLDHKQEIFSCLTCCRLHSTQRCISQQRPLSRVTLHQSHLSALPQTSCCRPASPNTVTWFSGERICIFLFILLLIDLGSFLLSLLLRINLRSGSYIN